MEALGPRVRSRSGCLTCKNRRKKCDEARPTCHRCKRAGMECLGYSHLDNPLPRTRRRRNKTDRSAQPQPLFDSSTQPANEPSLGPAHQAPPHSNPTFTQKTSTLTEDDWLFFGALVENSSRLDYLSSSNSLPDALLSSGLSGSLLTNIQDEAPLWSNGGFDLSASSLPHFNKSPSDQTTRSTDSVPPISEATSLDHLFLEPPSSSANNQELIGVDSSTVLTLMTPVTSGYSNHRSLTWPRSDSHCYDEDEEDSDVEGVMTLVGATLPLDPMNPSNSLPFILSSYFRWISRTFFEPLKIARTKKEHLIDRYSQSEDSRCWTMLVAIVMHSLDKNPVMPLESFPAMKVLEDRVNNQLAILKSRQYQPSVAYPSDVIATLHDFHEMISVQCLLRPLSKIIKVLDDNAPIYRQACLEPPGAPIHLSAKLVDPVAVLRHYPSMDILISFHTGRPMHFQYDISCVPESQKRVVDLSLVGLQWMNGVPDQFLVLLARMNTLLEVSILPIEPQIILEIETLIGDFKPALDDTPDPYLKIARLMVYETWRQVMYIYLYMGLCRVASSHIRVESALRKIVRLLAGVKPGRMPDVFLILPLCIAGVAAHTQRDRDIIRQRILGIRECAQMGTCGNDAVQMLNEVWTTCSMQSRHSVWADLRIAASRVTGIV